MRNKIIPYGRHLKPFARKLRQQGILSEVILWMHLKNQALGVEFHRQVPINDYIVDFYCHEIKLVIEIDGASHKAESVAANDLIRQSKLESLGLLVIRYHDADVRFNTDWVVRSIEDVVRRLLG